MKKLTVLLIILIIANCLSICPFAFEATEDEMSAFDVVSEYLTKYYSTAYLKTKYDVLNGTFAHLDDSQKNEILEKAKEYEDEIRDNHHYHFHEDNTLFYESETDEHGASIPLPPGTISNKRQYDNTAIEDVISSFPVFIEKKNQYKTAVYFTFKDKMQDYSFRIAPIRVTVSESGFAYLYVSYSVGIDGDSIEDKSWGVQDASDILLYKFTDGSWVICDISTYLDGYDQEYRFNSENLDVEKKLIEEGIPLLSENESTDTDESGSDGTDSVSADESENEANNSPQESKSTNYIPWMIICAIEAVAICALVIMLVLKKKK